MFMRKFIHHLLSIAKIDIGIIIAFMIIIFFFSMLTASLLLTWLYLRSRGSILVVAVFHAAFDIATTTPTTTKLIPMVMGGLITLVGLTVIPSLARTRRAEPAASAHRS